MRRVHGAPAIGLLGIVLLSIVLGMSLAAATQCDCKPEFQVSSEGEGTCEVARDDRKWCVIKFNAGGTARPPRQQAFAEATQKIAGFTFDAVDAARRVDTTPPQAWDEAFVRNYLAALFAVALWDRAPDRMKPIVGLVREKAAALVGPLQKGAEAEHVDLGDYQAWASQGCLEVAQRDFSVMVKTRFSSAVLRCGTRS